MLIKKSIHRHLIHFTLVIIIFGAGVWHGSKGKAETEGKLEVTEVRLNKLEALVSEIAKTPRNSVKNIVSDIKVKDGSSLDFTPVSENTLTEVETNIKPPDKKREDSLTKRQRKRVNELINKLTKRNKKKALKN